MEFNLSPWEEKILAIAENFTNSDSEITINKLFDAAKKDSPTTTNDLSTAINLLISKNYIVPGKRVTKDQLLHNGKRYRIYFYIRKNPSCSLNDIQKFTNINKTLINWHLAVLEQFKFIFHTYYENRLVFYPIEFQEKIHSTSTETTSIISTEMNQKIKLIDILSKKILDSLEIVSMLEQIGV